MMVINGRYELHERLGEGGMATVYRATQLNLEREVAIKFIKTEMISDEFIARFEREAKSIAQLNHPNITQVYDFDYDEEGTPFMVMEFLHGFDLGEFRKQHSPLKLSDVITIMEGAALALGYAHAHGIVHRDVKPSNIFITEDHQVKLMDFGLVKQASDETNLTNTGILLGTPGYFSPEQASAEPVDHRSDIYALGVILYELLTGEAPFSGKNPLDLAVQHVTQPVPDPRKIKPDLPIEASIITGRMMAKQPEDRFSNAAALLKELKNFEETVAQDSGILPRLKLTTSEINIELRPPSTIKLTSPIAADSGAANLTSTILRHRVALPLPILLVVLLVLAVVGALAASTLLNDNASANRLPTLGIAAAGEDEYLVLVGQWGDESDTLERRITDTLRSSDAVGISPHAALRIEPIEYAINSSENAHTLAESVGAHLVVWGVEDEVGIEVVFEDIYAEPNSASTLRFIIPDNEDFTTIMAEDIPLVLRFYVSSMLLHHFIRTGDIDGLASYGAASFDGSVDDLRILPASDLDRHILSMFIWEAQEDGIQHLIDASTDALRLAPGDPSLVFLRGFYEGFYKGNLTRAEADANLLREMLGENNLTIWVDMNLALARQDYAQILELSEKLDPDSLGYGIPFSYRQTALAMTGDFERVQEETQGNVSEQAVFGLPIWDTLAALSYEVQGDTEALEQAAAEVSTNRDLEDSASFITGIDTPPVDFYMLGGYIAELSGIPLQALLAYQGGLQLSPDHYLMNWRIANLSINNGNTRVAFTRLMQTRDNAPVPFPLATYQLAQLVHESPDDAPTTVASACSLLGEALAETEVNAEFYAPLIAKMEASGEEWGC